MELNDMVGTIRLLMICQVISLNPYRVYITVCNLQREMYFVKVVAAFVFMIMVVGNKCFLRKRQTKEEEKCLQKTSYAVNITIVIFSILAGRGSDD